MVNRRKKEKLENTQKTCIDYKQSMRSTTSAYLLSNNFYFVVFLFHLHFRYHSCLMFMLYAYTFVSVCAVCLMFISFYFSVDSSFVPFSMVIRYKNPPTNAILITNIREQTTYTFADSPEIRHTKLTQWFHFRTNNLELFDPMCCYHCYYSIAWVSI